MARRHLHIAAYDVRDPRRLRLAMQAAKKYATGGQKSVYECFLSDAERTALIREMRELLDADLDRFFLLRLDRRGAARVMGIARQPTDPDFFYFD